jgi:hypothetical protein
MPVEIREIEIKATVREDGMEKKERPDEDTIEEIIQETVERVLEILKNRKKL